MSKDKKDKKPDLTQTGKIDIQSICNNETKKYSAYLISIFGTNVGQMYRLENNKDFSIGRSSESNLAINDNMISRIHAVIKSKDNESIIFDKSTNGTFINNERVKKKVLVDGDKIQIGTKTILKFTIQDNIEETFQKKLYEMSVKDSLTGAYSKQYYLDTIQNEFSYHKRHNIPLSLMIIDIDDFKKINDEYGHLAGDYILKKLAQNLKSTLRQENILVRYGGDEFIIICKNCNLSSSLIITERIFSNINKLEIIHSNKKIKFSISLGFSILTNQNFSTLGELFERADYFLYQAKTKGKNCFSYDKDINDV